ncbi:MAG TPA: hypothetical protein VFH43_03940 [Candidatus Kapabacteria bacterium]|nr:hypothetical protein [Candidatus Kapabacteria bacterium]
MCALSLQSCTAVRDTTPCNSTLYLELSERKTMSVAELVLLDSLSKECNEYTERQKLAPEEDEYEGAGWWGVGVVGAGLLLIAYLSGLFG